MHGGGRGKERLSEASDLLQVLSSSNMSADERFSWKLERRFLHLGDGVSSRRSPSWKVAARLRFDDQGECSAEVRGDVVPEKLSELLSDLQIYQ